MLTGEDLGKAIRRAIELKGVQPAEVARLFEIKQPSVQGWMKTGRISKPNFERFRNYVSDVVDPDYWGANQPQGKNFSQRSIFRPAKHRSDNVYIAKIVELLDQMTDAGIGAVLRCAKEELKEHPKKSKANRAA